MYFLLGTLCRLSHFKHDGFCLQDFIPLYICCESEDLIAHNLLTKDISIGTTISVLALRMKASKFYIKDMHLEYLAF